MIKLVVYATFEQMHGRKSTITELAAHLKGYSRGSVVYVCCVSGMILKLWQLGAWDQPTYDLMIDSAFDFLRGDYYRLSSRAAEPEYVFHRRQLMLLLKLAIQYCPEDGPDLLTAPRGVFGTMLLMANDQFHYGLFPFAGQDIADESEKISRVLAEFVPINEFSGIRVENKIVRSHLMATTYAQALSQHSDFVDVPAEYEHLTGIPFGTYEALTFGLFARYGTVTIGALQANASLAVVHPENFHTTAIPPNVVQSFLAEFAAPPESFRSKLGKATLAQKEFGANDFTIFREKPLINERYGYLATDLLLVIEKFESGPYWRVNNVSKANGDRLRRFWGAVFEEYVNDLVRAACDHLRCRFIPNPRLVDDEAVQVCDGIIVHDDRLVLMEYKSSMFTAAAKYSGNHVLLREQVTNKLVSDPTTNGRKGVGQLAEAIRILLQEQRHVEGVDLRGIRSVYPLLLTLDDVGGGPLVSRLLNCYFDQNLVGNLNGSSVRPLFCTDIESLEVVAQNWDTWDMGTLLEHWLENDPTLMGTLLAFLPDGFLERPNVLIDNHWKRLTKAFESTLFPNG